MSKVKRAAAIMGRKGGKKKSKRKAAASRRNGKLGGRPKKIVHNVAFFVNEDGNTYVRRGKQL